MKKSISEKKKRTTFNYGSFGAIDPIVFSALHHTEWLWSNDPSTKMEWEHIPYRISIPFICTHTLFLSMEHFPDFHHFLSINELFPSSRFEGYNSWRIVELSESKFADFLLWPDVSWREVRENEIFNRKGSNCYFIFDICSMQCVRVLYVQCAFSKYITQKNLCT